MSKQLQEFAVLHNLTVDEYMKLVQSMRTGEVITCLELLRARRHRSEFRRNMDIKIRMWLIAANTNGERTQPLTAKEFEMARPKWPITYTLPT